MTQGSGRVSGGSFSRRRAVSDADPPADRRPGPRPGGLAGVVGGLAGLQRDRVGGERPARRAAASPATTCSPSMCRCSSRTSTSALVPAASPWALRAAAHQASSTGVNFPAARACSSAVAGQRAGLADQRPPGSGPGPGGRLPCRAAARAGQLGAARRGYDQVRGVQQDPDPAADRAAPAPSNGARAGRPGRTVDPRCEPQARLERLLRQRAQQRRLDRKELPNGPCPAADPPAWSGRTPGVDRLIDAWMDGRVRRRNPWYGETSRSAPRRRLSHGHRRCRQAVEGIQAVLLELDRFLLIGPEAVPPAVSVIPTGMADTEIEITADLVRDLLQEQREPGRAGHP